MIGLLLASALAGAASEPVPQAEAVPTRVQQPASTEMAVPAAPCCQLPALTPIELDILTPASSRSSVVGQVIKLRVAAPVVVNGQTLIPAGTEGRAEVIQVSRSALGGKAGELVIGAPVVTLDGQTISLKRFRYGPSNGKGNDTASMIATAVIGLPGMFISGGNVDIPYGARANAVVTRDTMVPPPTAAAPVLSPAAATNSQEPASTKGE